MSTPFAQALLEIACEEGNTTSLEEIRNQAFAKLQSGEVKSLITTSLNGKSATYTISQSADVLFTAVSWAIRQFHKGTITAVEWNFAWL